MADKVVRVQVMAETSTAKQQLQDLQAQLQSLSSQQININDASLVQANKVAVELQQNLQKAMNPNTGKLDLARFSAELNRSGRQLSDYATALQNLGPQGQQAFLSLSSAIASAEAPTTRLNAKLIKFGQTIKNTINWQISSSIIHGIVGQFQTAINYAEKLNQSLNNIRIVTGASTDKMAEFAEQANSAAKRLSTTTTQYTNASLIYYQQGLGDKEVAARTETTLKLANVSRQSVEEVSNQLTAIWNNYAEGSSNLEHYADVITALGAATASSSSEIATGLEKFAAIGKTVGLSYDYATTALATITATTRQSAETVGTGLRTLFSRLQSLKLGETLDDGVGLTKYSNALASVGVNIQDQYGKVKDMDQILDDLGAKWGTISKEQQIALAQTVGGVRQYTNLIALMDNWQYFQRNLTVAQGSEGTLQKQANIYSESWEAASKRVRVATEGIYSSLIDDKAIISLLDGFSKFLNIIEGITDGLGGMKGALLLISSIFMNRMAKEMPTFIKETSFGLQTFWNTIRGKPNADLKGIYDKNEQLLLARRGATTDAAEQAQIDKILTQQRMNQSLLQNQRHMSREDIAAYQTKMMLAGLAGDARIAQAQQTAQGNKEINDYIASISQRYKSGLTSSVLQSNQDVQAAHLALRQAQGKTQQYAQLEARMQAVQDKYNQRDQVAKRIREQIPGEQGEKRAESYLRQAEVNYAKEMAAIQTEFSKLAEGAGNAASSLEQLANAAKNTTTEKENEAKQGVIDAEEKAQKDEVTAVRRTAKELYDKGAAIEGKQPVKEEDLVAFKTGALQYSDRQLMASQYATMTLPLRSAASKVGNLYGTMDATNSLVNSVIASKNVKLSPADMANMKQQWGSAIQNIRQELIQNGGIAENGELAKELLGLTPEALANINIDQIIAKLQAIQARIKTELMGGTGVSEGEETAGSSIGRLNATINELSNKTGQVLGLKGEEIDTNIIQPSKDVARGSTSSRISTTPQTDLATPTIALSTTMMQVGSGLMMLNSALQSASNMVQQFGDDTATGLTKFGSVLTAITTAMMASGMIQNGANSIAKAIGGAAANAPGWIGLVISAVMTSIGVISGIVKAQKEVINEAYSSQMEKGLAAIENQQKTDELINAQSSLINAYAKATKAVEKGTITQQELQKQQQELIDQITNSTDTEYKAAMMGAALSGNATRIINSQKDYEIANLQQNLAVLQASNNAALGKITSNANVNTFWGGNVNAVDLYGYNAFTEFLSLFDPGNYYTTNGGLGLWNDNYYRLGSANSNTFFMSDDDARAMEIASTGTKYLRLLKDASNGYAGVGINRKAFSNLEDFYYFYKELLEKYNELQSLGLSNTNAAQSMKKQIDYWADDWETISQNYQAQRDYEIRLNILTEENLNQRITDLQSFNQVRQELIKKYTKDIEYGSEDYNAIINSIDSSLSQLSNVINRADGKNLYSTFLGLQSVLEGQKKFYNFDLLNDKDKADYESMLMEQYIDLYEHIGDAIFSLSKNFKIPLNLDFDNLDPTLKAIFESAQEASNKNKIQLALDGTINFKLNYESSYEEWEDFSKIVNTKLQKDFEETDKTLWEEVFGTKFEIWREFTKTQDEINEEMTLFYSHWNAQYWGPNGTFDTEYQGLLTQQEALETQEREAWGRQNTAQQNVTIAAGNDSWKYRTSDNMNVVGADLIPRLPAIEQFFELLSNYGIKNPEDVNKITTTLVGSDAFSSVLTDLGIEPTDLKALRDLYRHKDIIMPLMETTTEYNGIVAQQGEVSASIAAKDQELAQWKELGAFTDIARRALAEGLDMNELLEIARAQEIINQGYKDLALSEKDAARESQEFALRLLEQRKAIENGKKIISQYGTALDAFAKKQKQASDPDVGIGLRQVASNLKLLYGDIMEYTPEFIQDNWDNIKKAFSGDEAGFKEVGKAIIGDTLTGMLEGVNPDEVSGYISDLQAAFDQDKVEIGTVLSAIDPGEVSTYMGNLKSLLDAHKISMDDMIDLAKAGGYEPVTTTMTLSEATDGGFAQSGTVYVIGPDGSATPLTIDGGTENTGSSEQTYEVVTGWQKTSGGNAPPSGGGGGGKKKKDHKKPDAGTRYHTIKAKQANNAQNKQETSRQKQRAFGAEKIKQAQKEIDLQKESIELQRQYIDEITDYLAGDRKNMEDAFAGLGISLKIDENGVITNFREVEEELLRQENELIDQYNNGPLDDEAYQEAQKKIDEAREYLQLYEETRDLYEEQMIAMIELLDGLQDQLLELTKTKIEIQIDISDEKLEWLEYMLEKIGDDAYQTAEAIAFLGDKTGETLNRIDVYQAGLEEILGRKGFSLDDLDNLTDLDLAQANFTQAEIDQIREWKSELMDANKELLKMREEVIDKVIDGLDKLNEKVQNSYDNFNQYNDVLEKYKEITDLLGLRLNQQNKELLDSLGKATLANAQNQAASAKIIYETAKKAHDDAQKTYQEMVQRYGENSPEAQQWENLINTTQDALDEAQNNWLDAWNNALQIAQDIYINHIEQITKTFEEQVSGLFGSLDYLQSAFDRADQVGTEYLQDFEKLYELNKLNRDIQKQIDDTNNIRDKQALKELQKEINDLQEQGVKLSQYDVDALRKKFELEQARQALEDARNNKSEVRLHRDANGNWGYVYTAAEDEVADAEQEYENKLYEYQKLNDDYIKELQSRVLETQQQYKEALAEIYNDTTLTDEQRQARIDELNNWKDAELSYFEQQLNNALKNQQDTLDLYYKLYGNTQAALADSWEETTLKMLTGASSVEEYINNVQQAMLDMLNNSANALSDYNNNVDDSNNAAGVNTEEYANHVTDAIGEIGAASEETQTQITALAETLIGEFTSALEAAVKWEDEYAQKMKEAIEQNEKFIQSLNEMIARLAMIESNDPELKIARANYMLAEAKHEKFVEVNGDIYDKDWEKAKKDWQEYLDKYAAAASYDTGGYTGNWGSEGRMAILHEKENVFNATDTQRLLDAAQLLRTIDLSAKTFATGLGNILLPQIGAFGQTLDQNVHIEASFPNVTNHNEIEEALNNLVNRASQYANRKNMSSMTFQDMYTNKF